MDGLILAASMLILGASRRNRPVPPVARWCLGAGIAAYAEAVRRALPAAVQVNDRWHPWHGLAQAVQKDR